MSNRRMLLNPPTFLPRRRCLLGSALSFSVLLFAGTGQLRAQARSPWPSILPEELALKDNPAKPGSAAMVLLREVNTDDTKANETQYIKIKVFKEEGKKFGNIEIPYIDKRMQVEDIRARTIAPDGTAVDFQGEIFDRVVAKTRRLRVQTKTFTLPNVQAGSIIEYSYKLRWRDPFPDVLKNPGDYIITTTFAIPTSRWIIQHELFTRRARFFIRPLSSSGLQWTSLRLPDKASPRRQADGTIVLEMENVEPIENEDFMPPVSMLQGRVHFAYIIGSANTTQAVWTEWSKHRAEEIDKFVGKHKSIERAVAQIVASWC